MEELFAQKSWVGKALAYIGVAEIICGSIAFLALLCLGLPAFTVPIIAMAILCLVSGLFFGFIFFGFSEIVRTLNAISCSLGNEAGGTASGRQLPNL